MSEKEFDFTKKKRVVVKIGSSSLNRGETGNLNFTKLEHLVRELCDMRNRGMDVCLVSSGAIAVGRQTIGLNERPKDISTKQACAAVGQARLMMTYQRMFAEYNQIAGQILMTKNTMVNPVSRANAKNTFDELFHLGVIPVVNENDTVSTYEMQFGDNDTLSAIVSSLVGADLLILLSDIDGLFTDGHETGFSEGEKHGIELNSIETARRMLQLQEFSLEKIAAISGLSLDEIKKLQTNEARSDS